jgi:hypothetical protein
MKNIIKDPIKISRDKNQSEIKRSTGEQGAVAHACYPNYSGGHSRRIAVQGWPWQKARPYLTNN